MLQYVLDWFDVKWGRCVTQNLSRIDLAARQNGTSLKRDGRAKDTDEPSNVYVQDTDFLIAGCVGPVINRRRHFRQDDDPKDQHLAFRNDGPLNLEM